MTDYSALKKSAEAAPSERGTQEIIAEIKAELAYLRQYFDGKKAREAEIYRGFK